MQKRMMGKEMYEAIRSIQDCSGMCTQTAHYCLRMGGSHVERSQFRLLFDCAEICQTTANFALRESDFHHHASNVCAEICTACAEGCEKMPADVQMKACAEVCRQCAETCHELAASLL